MSNAIKPFLQARLLGELDALLARCRADPLSICDSSGSLATSETFKGKRVQVVNFIAAPTTDRPEARYVISVSDKEYYVQAEVARDCAEAVERLMGQRFTKIRGANIVLNQCRFLFSLDKRGNVDVRLEITKMTWMSGDGNGLFERPGWLGTETAVASRLGEVAGELKRARDMVQWQSSAGPEPQQKLIPITSIPPKRPPVTSPCRPSKSPARTSKSPRRKSTPARTPAPPGTREMDDPIVDSGNSQLKKPDSQVRSSEPPRHPAWGSYEHSLALAVPKPEQEAELKRLEGWDENWKVLAPAPEEAPTRTGQTAPMNTGLLTAATAPAPAPCSDYGALEMEDKDWEALVDVDPDAARKEVEERASPSMERIPGTALPSSPRNQQAIELMEMSVAQTDSVAAGRFGDPSQEQRVDTVVMTVQQSISYSDVASQDVPQSAVTPHPTVARQNTVLVPVTQETPAPSILAGPSQEPAPLALPQQTYDSDFEDLTEDIQIPNSMRVAVDTLEELGRQVQEFEDPSQSQVLSAHAEDEIRSFETSPEEYEEVVEDSMCLDQPPGPSRGSQEASYVASGSVERNYALASNSLAHNSGSIPFGQRIRETPDELQEFSQREQELLNDFFSQPLDVDVEMEMSGPSVRVLPGIVTTGLSQGAEEDVGSGSMLMPGLGESQVLIQESARLTGNENLNEEQDEDQEAEEDNEEEDPIVSGHESVPMRNRETPVGYFGSQEPSMDLSVRSPWVWVRGDTQIMDSGARPQSFVDTESQGVADSLDEDVGQRQQSAFVSNSLPAVAAARETSLRDRVDSLPIKFAYGPDDAPGGPIVPAAGLVRSPPRVVNAGSRTESALESALYFDALAGDEVPSSDPGEIANERLEERVSTDVFGTPPEAFEAAEENVPRMGPWRVLPRGLKPTPGVEVVVLIENDGVRQVWKGMKGKSTRKERRTDSVSPQSQLGRQSQRSSRSVSRSKEPPTPTPREAPPKKGKKRALEDGIWDLPNTQSQEPVSSVQQRKPKKLRTVDSQRDSLKAADSQANSLSSVENRQPSSYQQTNSKSDSQGSKKVILPAKRALSPRPRRDSE